MALKSRVALSCCLWQGGHPCARNLGSYFQRHNQTAAERAEIGGCVEGHPAAYETPYYWLIGLSWMQILRPGSEEVLSGAGSREWGSEPGKGSTASTGVTQPGTTAGAGASEML